MEEVSIWSGSSDHAPFAQAGVAGWRPLHGGGRARSRRDLAHRFGGAAGRPYDACYHQACDTLANINLRVLGQMADAAAVVALHLAG